MTEEVVEKPAEPWVGKILIPKQKFEIVTKPEFSIYKFSFSREGSDKAEKGQMYFYAKTLADGSKKLIELMNSESLFEAVIDPTPKWGYLPVNFPKAKFVPGGGGRPAREYPPYYRGRTLSEREFLAMYDRIKSHHLAVNTKIYTNLEQPELAELVRSETAQCVIMVKDGVWNPDK